MRTTLLLAVASACYSTSVLAQTERDLDSHLHGAASLNIAVVESAIFLEFNTPWHNLVGFEHEPQTDEQHSLVANALDLLNTPDLLLSFVDGDCSVDEVVLENSMIASVDDEHEESNEHDNEHDDEHKESNEHDDEHHADHEEADADGHSEVESTHSTVLASYSFQCDRINQLEKIELLLFQHWPGLTELDVQLVGDSGQTLLELNQENTSLDISQLR